MVPVVTVIQPEVAGIAETYETLNTLEMPVILDHMGRPDASQGLQARNVQVIVELLKRGNCWVMLSLSEKISKAGPPWDDVIPIAQACAGCTATRGAQDPRATR